MANPYTKVTPEMEQLNKYYEAIKAWKAKEPTIKSMFNYKMGALGSEERKQNQAKLDKARHDWKKQKPMKSDFTSTAAPTTAPTTEPKTQPKTQPKAETKTENKTETKTQPTTPATKEADKINKDLSSVKQRGSGSFLRSLLPSKDRLSPSQRFEARMGRKETYGERKRRRG